MIFAVRHQTNTISEDFNKAVSKDFFTAFPQGGNEGNPRSDGQGIFDIASKGSRKN
jgi:hypothetical protein